MIASALKSNSATNSPYASSESESSGDKRFCNDAQWQLEQTGNVETQQIQNEGDGQREANPRTE